MDEEKYILDFKLDDHEVAEMFERLSSDPYLSEYLRKAQGRLVNDYFKSTPEGQGIIRGQHMFAKSFYNALVNTRKAIENKGIDKKDK